MLLVEEGMDIIEAAREKLKEQKVIDTMQISYALAADKYGNNADMVKAHVQNNLETKENIANFLFADAEEIGNNQKNIPATNLLNILARLAQKNRPTVMAVGCEDVESIQTMKSELDRMLGGLLNMIVIKAQDFARTVTDLVNALAKTEIAL
jgi:hypothetical protein